MDPVEFIGVFVSKESELSVTSVKHKTFLLVNWVGGGGGGYGGGLGKRM